MLSILKNIPFIFSFFFKRFSLLFNKFFFLIFKLKKNKSLIYLSNKLFYLLSSFKKYFFILFYFKKYFSLLFHFFSYSFFTLKLMRSFLFHHFFLFMHTHFYSISFKLLFQYSLNFDDFFSVFIKSFFYNLLSSNNILSHFSFLSQDMRLHFPLWLFKNYRDRVLTFFYFIQIQQHFLTHNVERARPLLFFKFFLYDSRLWSFKYFLLLFKNFSSLKKKAKNFLLLLNFQYFTVSDRYFHNSLFLNKNKFYFFIFFNNFFRSFFFYTFLKKSNLIKFFKIKNINLLFLKFISIFFFQ